MSEQVPLVDYLVLGDSPHLEANECTSCGARFFGRRNACASCSGSTFAKAAVATEGEVKAFTIVSFAAPGIDDCDGTSVGGNLVNVEPDPEHVHLGMKVQLVTTSVGTDSAGTEAIGFGFQPVD